MGGGRGKDVAPSLAPWAAGLAGHAIEKNAQTTVEYQIIVRYEDGTKGMFSRPRRRAGAPATSEGHPGMIQDAAEANAGLMKRGRSPAFSFDGVIAKGEP